MEAVSGGVSEGTPTVDLQEEASDNGPYVIPFAAGTGGQQELKTDQTQLFYNPSNGRLNAQEFNSLSDIRYKENIELIENPMAKVEALRGVTYDWKSNGAGSAGIIAQEVKAVMPGYLRDRRKDDC